MAKDNTKALLISGISVLVIGAGIGIYFLVRKKGMGAPEAYTFPTSDTVLGSMPGGDPGGASGSGGESDQMGKYKLSDLGEGYYDFDVRFINMMNEWIYKYVRKWHPGERQKQLASALYQMKKQSESKKQKGKDDWFDDRMNKYSFTEIKKAFFKPKWTDYIVTWDGNGNPM